MRLDHPIFQGPLSVEVVLDKDHPFKDAHDDQGTWLVHSGKFTEGCDVGMVADGHGFEDSPDCERISGGINSKGPKAVAIGRQANMLQWGFYGAPDRMTESAKRAFLNTIVYMKRFDGQVPLVQKEGRGRTWYSQFLDTLEHMKPEELANRGERTLAGYVLGRFPPELTKDPVDIARLRKWYAENEEFLGPGKKPHETAIDSDLAALQLSNRKPEFLDWLLDKLGKPGDEQALQLAKRYLGPEHGADAATAKAWIQQNRPFLFFSDTGGYRWFVDTNAQRAGAKKPGPRDADARK
ncbi:MAG TPA: hypothetical protein VF384_08580 [Planctomycetota bacterium]